MPTRRIADGGCVSPRPPRQLSCASRRWCIHQSPCGERRQRRCTPFDADGWQRQAVTGRSSGAMRPDWIHCRVSDAKAGWVAPRKGKRQGNDFKPRSSPGSGLSDPLVTGPAELALGQTVSPNEHREVVTPRAAGLVLYSRCQLRPQTGRAPSSALHRWFRTKARVLAGWVAAASS